MEFAKSLKMSKQLKRLSKNIRMLRIRAGYNQIQASQRIGISNIYWNQIETGKKYPSLKTLDRISDAINVQIYELFK